MENDLQNEVEELASLQFSEDEILTIVGEDKEIDPLWIKRGRLKAEAEVRKSILSQAKQGSSPAQKEYMNLIRQNSTVKEIDYEALKNDIIKIVLGNNPKGAELKKKLYNELSSISVKFE